MHQNCIHVHWENPQSTCVFSLFTLRKCAYYPRILSVHIYGHLNELLLHFYEVLWQVSQMFHLSLPSTSLLLTHILPFHFQQCSTISILLLSKTSYFEQNKKGTVVPNFVGSFLSCMDRSSELQKWNLYWFLKNFCPPFDSFAPSIFGRNFKVFHTNHIGDSWNLRDGFTNVVSSSQRFPISYSKNCQQIRLIFAHLSAFFQKNITI